MSYSIFTRLDHRKTQPPLLSLCILSPFHDTFWGRNGSHRDLGQGNDTLTLLEEDQTEDYQELPLRGVPCTGYKKPKNKNLENFRDKNRKQRKTAEIPYWSPIDGVTSMR